MVSSSDKVSATFAKPAGSGICVKQFPSLVKSIFFFRALQATYSWPFSMTCAPNGGWPLILIVIWVLLRNWRAASGTVEGHADHLHESLKGRHFPGEVIVQAVRWYLQYPYGQNI